MPAEGLAHFHQRVRKEARSAPLFPRHEFFLHHREIHLTQQPCRGCGQTGQISQLYDVYLHPFYGAVTSTLRSTLIMKVPTDQGPSMEDYPTTLVHTPEKPVYVCYQCMPEPTSFSDMDLRRSAEGHRIENENLRAEMRRRDAEEQEGRRAEPKPRKFIPKLSDEEIF